MYSDVVFHQPILEIELGDSTVDCCILSLLWSKKEMNLNSGPAVFLPRFNVA